GDRAGHGLHLFALAIRDQQQDVNPVTVIRRVRAPPMVAFIEAGRCSPGLRIQEGVLALQRDWMRLALGILALLLMVALLVAAPLVVRRAQPWPDCISQVVIVKGPAGRPVECVCLGGTLSTCFDPGP